MPLPPDLCTQCWPCADVTVSKLLLASIWTDRASQATEYRKGRGCWPKTLRISIRR
jgi:hypothetical protein